MIYYAYCLLLCITIITLGVLTGIDWLIVVVSIIGTAALFVVARIDDRLYARRLVKQLRQDIEDYERSGS